MNIVLFPLFTRFCLYDFVCYLILGLAPETKAYRQKWQREGQGYIDSNSLKNRIVITTVWSSATLRTLCIYCNCGTVALRVCFSWQLISSFAEVKTKHEKTFLFFLSRIEWNACIVLTTWIFWMWSPYWYIRSSLMSRTVGGQSPITSIITRWTFSNQLFSFLFEIWEI